MNYHTDHKVNRNCKRIVDKLMSGPATIYELSNTLTMFRYDVSVALSALRAKGIVIKCTGGKFELTAQGM